MGTIYGWRKRSGQLETTDVKRLRPVQQENAKLKKLLAERDLEIEVMKEISQKNGKRVRSAIAGHVCARAWDLVSQSLGPAVCGPLSPALRVASGSEGRADRREHARVGSSISPF